MTHQTKEINGHTVLFVDGNGASSAFFIHPTAGHLGYCCSHEKAGGEGAAKQFCEEWAQWIGSSWAEQ